MVACILRLYHAASGNQTTNEFMKPIKLTIKQIDIDKAKKSYNNPSLTNSVCNCCVIAQALLRQRKLPKKTFLSVGYSTIWVYSTKKLSSTIYKTIYKIDKNGEKITHMSSFEWDNIQTPTTVILTPENLCKQ